MIQSILNVSEATALQTADKLAKGEAQDGAVQKNQVNFISSLPAYMWLKSYTRCGQCIISRMTKVTC